MEGRSSGANICLILLFFLFKIFFVQDYEIIGRFSRLFLPFETVHWEGKKKGGGGKGGGRT